LKRNAITLALVAVAAIGLAGCRQDMHNGPRYRAFQATGPSGSGDNRSVRTLPPGTVARGWLREDDALYTGKVNGVFVEQFPFAIGHDELARGQQRFNIYCTPCHGRLGNGQGMVVQRGLRQAASYHNDRLRAEKAGYFFDVITNGFGAMQGYAEQIPVRDRWLIIAYVRALQLSQHASLDDVPADRRGQLNETPAAGTEKPAAPAPEKR
jgi:mono/diheme cytochrome c family protein